MCIGNGDTGAFYADENGSPTGTGLELVGVPVSTIALSERPATVVDDDELAPVSDTVGAHEATYFVWRRSSRPGGGLARRRPLWRTGSWTKVEGISSHWIFLSAVSLLLGGIGVFIAGIALKNKNLAQATSLYGVSAVGLLVYCAATQLLRGSRASVANGSGSPSKERLSILVWREHEEEERWRRRLRRAHNAACFAGVLQGPANLLYSVAFAIAPESRSAVSATYCVAGPVLAILVWMFHKKRPSRAEWFALSLLSVGILLMSSGGGAAGNAVVGALIGLAGAVTFAASQLAMIRAAAEGMRDSEIIMRVNMTHSAVWYVLVTIGLLVYKSAQGEDLHNDVHDSIDDMLMFISGIIRGAVWELLQRALTRGLPGVVSALANAVASVVLLLDLSVFGIIPSVEQVGGLLFVMLALVIVARSSGSGKKSKDRVDEIPVATALEHEASLVDEKV